MNSGVIRLSIEFFTKVKGFERDGKGKVKAPPRYKNVIMRNVEEIMAGGMPEEKIRECIELYVEECQKPEEAYSMDDVLLFFDIRPVKKRASRDPNNLMVPGQFYYHPRLQETPPPPKVVQNPDGSFSANYDSEPFYLEMRDSFTYSDMVLYFHERMGRAVEEASEREIGAFKHIMEHNDLDLVMYSIDASRYVSEDTKRPFPKSPFDIRDFMEEGQYLLESRKNISYMEGLNHVIPRTV